MIVAQCKKLLNVGDTLEKWNECSYSSFLRFCDEQTLEQARSYWALYAKTGDLSATKIKAWKKTVNEDLRKIEDSVSGGMSVKFLRSAGMFAPEPNKASDLSGFGFYWKKGLTSRDAKLLDVSTIPNPTLIYSTMGEKINIYRGCHPFHGFPLETFLAPIKTAKKDEKITSFDQLAVLAKELFGKWGYALRAVLFSPKGPQPVAKPSKVTSAGPKSNKLVVRYICADALSFCKGLLYFRKTNTWETPYFRRNFGCSQLCLSKYDYSNDVNKSTLMRAPTVFNMIDASFLADSLGLLNILTLTSQLLDRATPSSAIYTEGAVYSDEADPYLSFGKRLLGDVATMSLILGVTPTGYLTEFTTMSNTHEVKNALRSLSGDSDYRVHDRMCWKSPCSGDSVASTLDSEIHRRPLRVEPRTMARFLHGVYNEMFKDEIMGSFKNQKNKDKLGIYPSYIRTSFIQFLLL
ncbi:hypothetical protein HDU67_004234, partial [Dinochytrium kinnereticum]